MSSSFLMTKLKQRRLYIALVKHTRHAAWRPPLCRQNAAPSRRSATILCGVAQYEEYSPEVIAIQRLWRGHRVRSIIEETAPRRSSTRRARRSTAGGGGEEEVRAAVRLLWRSHAKPLPRQEAIAGWVRRRLHTAEAKRAATYAVVIQRRWRGFCERKSMRRLSIDRRLAAFGGSGGGGSIRGGGGGGGVGGGDDASVLGSPAAAATPRTPRTPTLKAQGSEVARSKAAVAARRESAGAPPARAGAKGAAVAAAAPGGRTEHVAHPAPAGVAELQLSWEESLLVDELGGDKAWQERLKPKSRVQSGGHRRRPSSARSRAARARIASAR